METTNKELNEKTKREIAKARKEKNISHKKVKKKLGHRKNIYD